MTGAALLAVLLAWTRQPAEELRPWADAMADVCDSPRECLRLAALAVEETAFQPWAIDGRCNDHEWRQAHQMHRACDSGRAFGPWQVWDARFAGATPEFQASVALEMMRAHPQQWTTRRRAWRDAEAWLSIHPAQ